MDTEVITKELQAYNTTNAAIAQLKKDYMALTIAGLEDKEGYEKVHAARMDVKTRRVQVKKKGEELREDANKFRTLVIDEVKRITSLLAPIEDHLSEEESRVDEEKERIKREAAELEAKRIQGRVNRLFAMGCRFDGTCYTYGRMNIPHAMVKVCSDEQFDTFCAAIQEDINKDLAEKAEKEQIQKEEAERLAQVAREQEAERQRLAKEAKTLQAERDRIDREKREAEEAKQREIDAKKRKEELEKAKAEAAEKAIAATEARLKAEAEAKAAKEEAARVRAAKKEARLPDKKRIIAYIDSIVAPQMELKTEDGSAAWMDILTILERAVAEMRQRAEQL